MGTQAAATAASAKLRPGPLQSVYRLLRRFADARRDTRRIASGKRPVPAHLLTGERGEDIAYFYLRQRGYTVVGRRWVSPHMRGDLDLIAWDGATLVAFEVKARTLRGITPADFAIDAAKQDQLRRMLRAYLSATPQPFRAMLAARFDVLSIYTPDSEQPEVEHLTDAFPRFDPSRRVD